MDEKDLLNKINEESENNVPDVYNKILFAAHAEGLLNSDGNTEAYSDGETVVLGGVNRKAIAITTLAALAAVSLAVALPIALSGKYDGGLNTPPLGDVGEKVITEIDLGDSYSYGAVTTARLAEDLLSEPAGAKAMSKRTASADDLSGFGTYFSALDCYLGKDQLTMAPAQSGDYQKSITISGRRTNGNPFDYVMQYTEYKLVKKDYVSGDPVNYYLEGIISVSGAGLSLLGERTLASDAEDAEETALNLYAYPNLNDKTTYAQMQLQFTEIGGVTVKSYSYKIVKNDAAVSEAVTYKTADDDLVIKVKEGETDKGIYTVTGETEDGEGYNVNYVLGSEQGKFTIKASDNGLKYEFPDPEYEYSFLGFRDNGDGTYSVSTYDKNVELPETLFIPSTYSEKPVVSIGNGAFKNSSFKKVIISEGITKVEYQAFESSTIEEIEFPSTLTQIEAKAFDNCGRLKELNLPSSLKGIGSIAFRDCDKLTEVTVPNGVENIEGSAFADCGNLVSVNLPASLNKLGSGAFTGCKKLESITVDAANPVYHSAGNCVINTANKVLVAGCSASVIPDDGSVTEIGFMAFNSVGLTELNLPSCVTVIGEAAFEYNQFTSLNLPEGLRIIKDYAFDGCELLTELTLPSTLIEINAWAFKYCGFESVNIPENVYLIGAGVFSGCSELKELTVDSENLNYHVSGNCIIDTGRKTLVAGCSTSQIPDDGSVETIGDQAFELCTLTEITIPSAVKVIGWCAFMDSNSLTKVVMEGVTEIDYSAFWGCEELETVVFSNDLQVIDSSAFAACYKLKNITLPQKVVITGSTLNGGYIGTRAFYNCSELESIVISEGFTTLDNEVFLGCTKLTTVTIPKTVTLIEGAAFAGCNSLTTINFSGTMAEWNKVNKNPEEWSYVGDYVVVCTDGTLSKDGTAIN